MPEHLEEDAISSKNFDSFKKAQKIDPISVKLAEGQTGPIVISSDKDRNWFLGVFATWQALCLHACLQVVVHFQFCTLMGL